jgi:glutamate/aspartate transport system substrate-binding protein
MKLEFHQIALLDDSPENEAVRTELSCGCSPTVDGVTDNREKRDT